MAPAQIRTSFQCPKGIKAWDSTLGVGAGPGGRLAGVFWTPGLCTVVEHSAAVGAGGVLLGFAASKRRAACKHAAVDVGLLSARGEGPCPDGAGPWASTVLPGQALSKS